MTTTAGGGRLDDQEDRTIMAPAAELHAMSLTMARVEAKLDGLVSTNVDHEARLRVQESYGCKNHADRISNLERWRWVMTGVAAGAGAGAAELARALASLH